MDTKQIIESYNLEYQELEKLDGYTSVNYRVKSNDINYLLKYYSNPDEFKLIFEEDCILNFLQKENFPFQVSSSIQKMKIHDDKSFSRLLPFIEGKLLSSVTHSDKLLYNFGQAVGMLNKSLMHTKSDIIQSRELFWDMKHTLLNAKNIGFITQPEDKKVVSYFFDLFSHYILPIQKELRFGIIHSDLNDNNVIVENDKVTGLIDFGDITYSPLIYEVAIAVTYIMLANEANPFEKASEFIQGYHSKLPLKKEEIEILSILIPSRLSVSVCNSAKKKYEGEDTDYVLVSEKPAWELLHKWLSINPAWITSFFLESINLSPEKPDRDELIAKRKKFTGKSLETSYKEPLYMTGAAFQYMYDHSGNTYLDAYNNIPHIGHCHPNVSKTLAHQARKLNTNTRYLYPELVDYASELTKTLPDDLHKVFYLNSGSAAVDLALRIAQTYTNKNCIAILENGYHGNTISGIAVSDYKHNGKGGKGKPANVITLDLPKTYNGKFKTGKEYAHEAIAKINAAIENGCPPAALIVEPISGCGGQVPLAEGYLKELAPFLKENSILLIVDEVQTGFGRLGKYFWGFEMHEIVPDIVVLGKPMGNGHPIAASVTTDDIADGFANGMEFFTSFGGNPVSCSVALEVLKTVQEEKLQLNAKSTGAELKKRLLDLKSEFECIGDVRGEGLFIGIEFIDKNGDPGEFIASFIKETLKKNFILVGTDGPFNNVIKIKPPLCFNIKNVETLMHQTTKAIKLATAMYMRS